MLSLEYKENHFGLPTHVSLSLLLRGIQYFLRTPFAFILRACHLNLLWKKLLDLFTLSIHSVMRLFFWNVCFILFRLYLRDFFLRFLIFFCVNSLFIPFLVPKVLTESQKWELYIKHTYTNHHITHLSFLHASYPFLHLLPLGKQSH